MKYYFAPMNLLGNYLYRHFLFENGADFCFSEMIRCDDYFDKEIKNDKLKVYSKDEYKKTIFQIAAQNKEQIEKIMPYIKNTKELNLNMGCPHSTFQKNKICSGLLIDENAMKLVATDFANICIKNNIIPSVKLRLGPKENIIRINEYLKILEDAKIKKAYIHCRTLNQSYQKPIDYNSIKLPKTKLEIIINGDIDSIQKAQELIKKFKPKGIMIGRFALKDPLIFKKIKENKEINKLIINKSIKTLTKEYEKLIKEFIQLAKDTKYLKQNLKHLLKDVSKNSLNNDIKFLMS
ncbi:tRNA-dihydrouridine synthase family protein [Candidatus Woesearchaeota archaeon]|nr:tRNA-dihydrouridine synthase family protein [Candidatus Woesearchaeota archaeon]